MNTTDKTAVALSGIGTITITIAMLASVFGNMRYVALTPLAMAVILAAVFLYCAGGDANA